MLTTPMAQTFTLHLPNIGRVAGEIIQGHVDVNVPMALQDQIENVRIMLRGSIVTKMTETRQVNGPNGQRTETYQKSQTVPLLRVDQQIWDNFNSPQNLQILTCPFSIQLPSGLPPSFHYSSGSLTAAVSYSISVVGARHGVFHANRRIRQIFSVVPSATAYELNAREALRQGWNGPWKPIVNNRKMRRGIFGDYADAKVELMLPDLQSFPMSTSIPFSCHFITRTKPVHHDDLDHKGEKLFPAPPDSPADVELELKLLGHVRAHGSQHELNVKYDLKGSLGDKASVGNVRITTDEPAWNPLPDHKDKGTWTRGVRFEGFMSFPFAPTFSTATADWHYQLKFDMDYPGIGNHLVLEFPIHINSGCACPPPPNPQYNANVPYAYPLSSGPPPIKYLPAGYWSGNDHDWTEGA
ncbi:hypothetical protein B0H14DRAFT_2798611 [Mycena olivaceomarginata]|nr:hypothetical protein B0H14DRAFT_2798611 [Mycena olivaceomarginata]